MCDGLIVGYAMCLCSIVYNVFMWRYRMCTATQSFILSLVFSIIINLVLLFYLWHRSRQSKKQRMKKEKTQWKKRISQVKAMDNQLLSVGSVRDPFCLQCFLYFFHPFIRFIFSVVCDALLCTVLMCKKHVYNVFPSVVFIFSLCGIFGRLSHCNQLFDDPIVEQFWCAVCM